MTGQILAIIFCIVMVILMITYLSDLLLIGFGIVAAFIVLRVLWMLINSR